MITKKLIEMNKLILKKNKVLRVKIENYGKILSGIQCSISSMTRSPSRTSRKLPSPSPSPSDNNLENLFLQ